MITKATLKFLAELKKNNSRDWFDANRARYKAAREEFIILVDALIGGVAHFEAHVLDLAPEDCIFRINRDTRFSKNKEPYKPHLGAFITDRGRKVSRAGYYIHLETGGCMIAGGIYMPPAPELKAIRRAIQTDAAPLRKILADKNFIAAFGKELPGMRLKTAPRDVPKDHPDLDLLRYQSFEVFRPASDASTLTADFAKACVQDFQKMAPFVKWINAAFDRYGPPPRAVDSARRPNDA